MNPLNLLVCFSLVFGAGRGAFGAELQPQTAPVGAVAFTGLGGDRFPEDMMGQGNR